MTCPLRYRFRVIDRLPEPPSIDAVRGTLVHAVLEHLFDMASADRTPESAVDLIDPQWKQILADRPELDQLFGSDDGAWTTFFDEAASLVRRYFTLEDPSRLEPADRELHVEYEREDGLFLHGYIDRLDRNAAGETRIVDYKTGKAPKPGWEAKAFFQMKFYAVILWRTTGRIPRSLQLVYLGDGTILRHEPDEADLVATEAKVIALWSAIAAAIRTGHWPAQRGPLCAWCSFQALCPEFGGTPPPLPAHPEQLVDAIERDPFEAG
jgi:putative RecB family exonuclease